MKKAFFLAIVQLFLLAGVSGAFQIEFRPNDTVYYPTNTLVAGNSGWSVVDNVTLNRGYFHGLAYFNNSIYGVTRTEPAYLCRFNTSNLSDNSCQQYSMAYFRDIKVVDNLLYVTSQVSDGDATGYVRQIDPNNFTILNSIATVAGPDALVYCNNSLFTGSFAASNLAAINITALNSTTYSSEMTKHHGLLCDSDESKVYSTGYSSGFSDIQYFNTSDPNERNTRKVIIGYSFADDPSIDGEWIYTCAENNGGMLRINKTNFNQYEVASSDNGCYGTYSDGSLLYSLKISSPARITVYEKNLTIYDTFVLPDGFNSLNEYVTDPNGNIYVTTWEANAKVLKLERPNDNYDVMYQLYRNGTLITTNETFDNSTLTAGVYNYTYTSTEGANLTANSTTQYLYVLEAPTTTSTTTTTTVPATTTTTPPAEEGSATKILRGLGSGIGGLFTGMSAPLLVFIVLMALGTAIGYLMTGIGKKVGGKL